MGKMEIIRKLNVRVGRIQNANAFKHSAHGLAAMADLQQELEAPVVSVNVSMGRHSGSLPLKKIRQILASLFKFYQNNGNEIQKIKVSGVDDEDEKDEFDLLNHKIVEVSEVELAAWNRRLSYDTRRHALHTAWKKHRGQIGRR